LRSYQGKKIHVIAELIQAAERNVDDLKVVSKIFDARYNGQEKFNELLVAWRLSYSLTNNCYRRRNYFDSTG
jgi:hypothetical protein